MVHRWARILIALGCLGVVVGRGFGGDSDSREGKAAPLPGGGVVVEKGQAAKPTSTGGDYIRYTEQGKEAKLQTAIAHFVRARDGATVDLIAVVHVADQAYYDELDNRMIVYDAVLYEMVGGPYRQEVEENAKAGGSPLQGVALVHGVIRSLLKLEYQKDGIDYMRKNFIHADVDWEKFQSLSVERDQTITSWFERAMDLAESENLPGVPQDERESRMMLGSLVGAVINGDATTLKRTLAPVLSQAETLISRMEGSDGTVLVTERNKVAIEVLREQLHFGKRRLAVLYGGGHMPDLEKRLAALGFQKAKTEWIDAWNIRDDPAERRTNILTDLLKDERVGGLLDAAMRLLDQTRPKAAEKKQ